MIRVGLLVLALLLTPSTAEANNKPPPTKKKPAPTKTKPSPKKKKKKKKTPRAMLYGVGMTPNWAAPSPLTVDASQQQAEVGAICGMRSTLTRFWLAWPDFEPQEGRFDPEVESRLDAVLRAASACRIRVIVVLSQTPAWATDGKPGYGVPYPGTYAAAVAHLAARFPSLFALEVWNEPLSYYYWSGSPEQYAALVNEAVRGRGSSSMKILAGSMQNGANLTGPFLTRLYAAGMRGQDGIAIHPYTFVLPRLETSGPKTAFQEVAETTHQIMAAHGDRGGVWITEFGYGVCPASPICFSEAEQAQNLVASFALGRRFRWVRGLTAFSIRDIQGWQRFGTPFWDHRAGMLTEDFQPRPAYYALHEAFKKWSRKPKKHRKHKGNRKPKKHRKHKGKRGRAKAS